ncbi:NAD(P)-dependent oxidoreductase [Frankia sp. Cas3]|uniref:NAD(P)-dependent oxidoreductase n=1 Tax=Frankia sp. Cas3 TaxID=3073926 RepID=UPI002AD4A697|nr:NAD(P)-dependent oxidoreductase [Frankia sp. Cas3]
MTAGPRVGFVGAGQMGGPMVERLLAAGLNVHLYARRAAVAARFADLGAAVHDSLPDLARSAEIVIVCAFSDGQLWEIAAGDGGLLAAMPPATILVNHTTGQVATLENLAARARAHDVEVVDAPVSGTAGDILAGRLTVLVGGTAAAIETCSPAVRAYAGTIVPTGPVGTATKIKLINNALFAANLQLTVDAMRVAEEMGVDPALVAGAVVHCSGNSYAMGKVDAMGWQPVVEQAMPYLVKDVGAVEQAAQDLGVDLGVLGAVARGGSFAAHGEPHDTAS